jgi:purine-nucleoside phosphorylase
MSNTAQNAADVIRAHHDLGVVETAVILGRSFYGLADIGETAAAIPYANLPGFPQTPSTQDAELVICKVDGVSTLMLKGRVDFHEVGDPSLMSEPIETLSLLGVRNLISTGFVTSVNADISPSGIATITDHIDFKGLNPLIGTGGAGFLNMNEAYDRRLLRRLKLAASAAGVSLHEGVLMWFSGPSYETVAEAKAARVLDADLIGMSIAPEAILARRFGVAFAGVAIVTDFGAGFSGGAPNGDFTRAPVAAGMVALKRLLRSHLKK